MLFSGACFTMLMFSSQAASLTTLPVHAGFFGKKFTAKLAGNKGILIFILHMYWISFRLSVNTSSHAPQLPNSPSFAAYTILGDSCVVLVETIGE